MTSDSIAITLLICLLVLEFSEAVNEALLIVPLKSRMKRRDCKFQCKKEAMNVAY